MTSAKAPRRAAVRHGSNHVTAVLDVTLTAKIKCWRGYTTKHCKGKQFSSSNTHQATGNFSAEMIAQQPRGLLSRNDRGATGDFSAEMIAEQPETSQQR